MRRILIVLAVMFCSACASTGGDSRKLEQALYAYAGAIRWGDLAGAMAFVDPELREKLKPSSVQQQRMEQLQITGYYVQGSEQASETELRQVVEIRLVNRHTLVERSVIDRQVWRWKEADKAWWLTTPLPDFAPTR